MFLALVFCHYFYVKIQQMKLDTYTDSKFLWRFVVGLALIVYFVGMLVTIMEIDGAVYAEISREMSENGKYLEILYKGNDWLDKPHFQFWFTAVTFKLFGSGNFTYKLPAVLFMLLGAYYTYLFGRKFYSRKHGYLAAMLLMTSQHIITSNSDVRVEPYLTGLTIFSLYYLAIYLNERKFYQMVLGSAGLACLLMTKGLYTIIPVASGLGLSMLYEKKWKQILNWQWIGVVALILLFIAPTIYGYYQQFDLHPEKVLFGETNISGIKFFLWDSQWGRFTNTGPIKGAGDPTFFLHTMLWAYMPWAFLAYFALYIKGKKLLQRKNSTESYTFFGFVFLFIVFSLSRFQLPHYLNALFPLLSIVTADVLVRFAKNRTFLSVFNHVHLWSSVLLVLAVILLHIIFSDQFPKADVFFVFFIGMFLIVKLWIVRGHKLKKLIFIPAITILMVNYYINRSFYPKLLGYQAESEVVHYMRSHELEEDQLVTLGMREDMVSFMQKRIVPLYDLESVEVENLHGKFVFTNREGIIRIHELNLIYEELKSFPDFRITTLNGTFLNKKTREKELEMKYLLKVR